METGTILDSEVDRLSSLPDDLLYKILSYVDTIYSVRLSVLSSRLRFIWTLSPNINLKSAEVSSETKGYSDFVNYVLSARNNKIDVSSVSLMLSDDVEDHEVSTKRILEYVFSHNVQQLSVSTEYFHVSTSQLSSKSLKHLTMIRTLLDCRSYSPWDLPALTTLNLQHVQLDNHSCILAMCQNLKNLTLDRCLVVESEYSDGFTINNSQLLSLTLKKVAWYVDFVYVDTPQLKNLIFVDTPQLPSEIIDEFSGKLTISARDLTYLHIKCTYFPKLSLDEFPSLESANLWISSPQKTDVPKIRDVFQRLHSVKSLSLSLEIVELLSTSEEVISHQPSPFTSLKSLKIYPLKGSKAIILRNLNTLHLQHLWTYPLQSITTQVDEEQEAMKIKLSAECTEYLLDSSSNATFTMVSHEEVRAIKITKAAYRLMADLWKSLEEYEAYTETKRDNVEWKKKTLADSEPEDLETKIWQRGDSKLIFSILKILKVLVTKVLASKRVEMQACFSRLSTKSKTAVNKMVADMRNQCEIKQHIFNAYFDEIDFSS